MNKKEKTNLAMLFVAAALFIAVNAGVWVATQKGVMPSVENVLVWGAFVSLNVASLLWAISLLGLQPLVVALSYLAGGFLAFQGVRGMPGISVAEVTCAGATYGAFGALAVGNATARVRLAFFRKGQVPFMFVILGLIVVDGILNSRISMVKGPVILNALVFPFLLAGVVVGLIWMVLNRFGIGQSAHEAEMAKADEHAEVEELESVEAVASKLVIEMPQDAVSEGEDGESDDLPSPVALPLVAVAEAAEEVDAPLVVASEVKPAKEEEFFPLEIDKDDAFILPELVSETDHDAEEEFPITSFDAESYVAGLSSMDDDAEGRVMIEEPPAAVAVEKKQETVVEPVPKAEPEKKNKSEDWLSNHLDLLNKLK
ncbi:hypothetical protein [Pontiella sulfatireligans]|uniref:Uncharacterized protein n=1 Tax=Pontiella sulfatireligans TaxID=2750658 RepID=A0A6C2UNL4_9BACT|nr:hypothetical protein [Pontiella sulfatireligans]VGO20927.1 hypothetical protein SCARR_02994 [Pontiella sulfatireligans]